MPRALLTLVTMVALSLAAAAEARDKGHCPPGLAKKDVPCVPPGQAKKRHSQDDDHAARWQYGDPVEGDYVLIPRADWERLRLRDYRDGSAYLRLDNQILRVVRDTLVVIEAVRILDQALN